MDKLWILVAFFGLVGLGAFGMALRCYYGFSSLVRSLTAGSGNVRQSNKAVSDVLLYVRVETIALFAFSIVASAIAIFLVILIRKRRQN